MGISTKKNSATDTLVPARPQATSASSAPPASADVAGASYRSGAAARLSGVPVETLRVWERRYAVTAPQRSANRQRLYSFDDVRRLGMIKQLVDLGNQIGAIARLPSTLLGEMLEVARKQGPAWSADSAAAAVGATGAASAGPGSAPLRRLRLALVGPGLALRYGAGARPDSTLELVRSSDSLHGAADLLLGAAVDVLVLELSEVSEPLLPAVAELRQASGARAVLLIYRFCAARTLRLWRKAGYLLARAPLDAGEIEALCRGALHTGASGAGGLAGAATPPGGAAPAAPARKADTATETTAEPAPRLFDDQALAVLGAASDALACECPRHMTEILLMLGSFERYSALCEHRHPADAALHQDLHRTAGQARALFEQALLRLAVAEGLPLPGPSQEYSA